MHKLYISHTNAGSNYQVISGNLTKPFCPPALKGEISTSYIPTGYDKVLNKVLLFVKQVNKVFFNNHQLTIWGTALSVSNDSS